MGDVYKPATAGDVQGQFFAIGLHGWPLFMFFGIRDELFQTCSRKISKGQADCLFANFHPRRMGQMQGGSHVAVTATYLFMDELELRCGREREDRELPEAGTVGTIGAYAPVVGRVGEQVQGVDVGGDWYIDGFVDNQQCEGVVL